LPAKFGYFLAFFLQGAVQFEISCESESLSDCKRSHENVSLHDIVGKVAEILITVGFVIGPKLSITLQIDSACDGVEERSLSCS
jgi:hypothetical protein